MCKVNKSARCRLAQACALAIAFGIFSASATHKSVTYLPASEINATFSGELFDVPCKFLNTTDLDFDFKEVETQEIDEKTHFVDKSLQMSCDTANAKKLLTMRLLGTVLAGAANNVLDGGLPNLGIAMTSADSGKAFDFDTPITEGANGSVMTVNLRATLINNAPETAIETGEFSTELTLAANYE